MIMQVLIGVAIGLLIPPILRTIANVLHHNQENSVPLSRERTQMLIKDGHK